jgi:hypothetical protein
VHRSGYLGLFTVVLGLLSGAPDSVCQQQQPERKALPTLTKAHDAHSLTSEQAARGYPIMPAGLCRDRILPGIDRNVNYRGATAGRESLRESSKSSPQGLSACGEIRHQARDAGVEGLRENSVLEGHRVSRDVPCPWLSFAALSHGRYPAGSRAAEVERECLVIRAA